MHPHAGSARVIGITGAPGAGKSTLTGRLIALLCEQGLRPAVLAVDPSSPLTGGAILGDRIRMDDHAGAAAFIRSVATRGHSGGLAVSVPGSVRAFDAAGYDPIIIETVGVGQVEVDVVAAADTTVVVVTPGFGDAVQANKAGLLEVADVFVVNKADRPGADDTRRDLELMLDLSHMTGAEELRGGRAPIVMTTATDGRGADTMWSEVVAHGDALAASGELAERHARRSRAEIVSRLDGRLRAAADKLLAGPEGRAVVAAVTERTLSPTRAGAQLAARLLTD